MTEILNEQSFLEITEEIKNTVNLVCEKVLEYEEFNFNADICITFTDNYNIHILNKEHRGVDSPTDVLSFPMLCFDNDGNAIYNESDFYDDNIVLGDIVISTERAAQQAEEYGHSIIREIAFLTAHSMLHLLGYDHVNDEEGEKIMISKQKEILTLLGFTRDK